MKLFVRLILAAWLALVFTMAASDAFVAPPGTPPVRIVLGVTVPVLLFFAFYRASAAFREFVQSASLPLITAMQAWRFGGAVFIAFYLYGLLPGIFAWPAGLGDMAVGITAPWIALALVRRPSFALSRGFFWWNLFGILDLVVAVSIGGLNAALTTGAAGEINVTPMGRLPLVLVPTFMVPLFLILHAATLLQVRERRRFYKESIAKVERAIHHESRGEVLIAQL